MNPDTTPIGSSDWVRMEGLIEKGGKPLSDEIKCDFATCKTEANKYFLAKCCSYASLMCTFHTTAVMAALHTRSIKLHCPGCEEPHEDLRAITMPENLRLDSI